MNKFYTTFLLLFSFIVTYGQYNDDAPWMQNKEDSKKERNFEKITTAFNEYWKDKDFRKKGSGFKPFKRWENYWQNLVKEDGTLMTSEEFWTAWQQKNKAKKSTSRALPTSNWTPIGPFTHTNTGSWSSGQGRVNFVYEDPTNPNTLYIGSPAGGIWKSTNSGANWTPLSDQLPQIGVSGIAVDHTNSNVIYIATGDKDGQDTYSVGVLKSTDGGLTWNITGLSFTGTSDYAGDIMMHPSNNQILWCATNSGIFKTSNGGTTWTNVQSGNFSKGNIRLRPSDPTTVYAVSNTKFYKSTNTGDTFTEITTGLPALSGRLNLDVTAADANYIYILSATTGYGFQGVYRSTNSGTNWTKISTAATPAIFDGSGQAGYDMALAVSSSNKDEIYTGLLNVWKSTNGGLGFTKLNDWSNPSGPAYTHADIHFLRYYGSKLYAGTDGGVYVSNNNGANFTDLTAGLQISQFYKVAVSKQSAGKMVGGLQDNGGHAYSSSSWKNYYGADGMDTAVDPTNSNIYYGFIQFGGGLYISNNAGESVGTGVSAPATETGTNDDGGNWVTPLMMNNSGDLFAGYNRLYKLNTCTFTWDVQSNTTIGSGDVEQIAVAPNNDNIMFVSNGNQLYKSTDKGINFSLAYTAPSTITSICVNYSNNNIVYLTTSGTGGLALKSTTGGTSFTSFSENLPTLGKNVIKHQGRNSLNPLYLGTTLGVYYRDDSMSQWEPFEANLPNVSVTDLEVNLEDNILTAATYGRGIWQTPIPVEIPTNDVKLVEITSPTADINCSGNISPIVVVKNNGTTPINQVTVSYDYGTGVQNHIWNGTIAPSTSQNITIPALTITNKGAYVLNVSTAITGDAFLDNNSGKTSFFINNSEALGVINTFESASDELLTSSGNCSGVWQRGINTNGALATPGNNVYTVGVNSNYPDNKKEYLYSKCYDFTNAVNPVIRFKLGFALEQNWDVAYVEYSTNMGQSWSVLGTQGPSWYNSNRTNATTGSDCYNCPGAQWTGGSGAPNTGTGAVPALTSYFYGLNALIGQPNVIFRVVFHSDGSVNDLGITIDDFVIEGTLSNQEFELKNIAIYPNPSTAIFTVAVGNESIDKLQVYDVAGKIIFETQQTIQNQYKLDLSSASSGIYFVKITSNNQNIVKRIIKN